MKKNNYYKNILKDVEYIYENCFKLIIISILYKKKISNISIIKYLLLKYNTYCLKNLIKYNLIFNKKLLIVFINTFFISKININNIIFFLKNLFKNNKFIFINYFNKINKYINVIFKKKYYKFPIYYNTLYKYNNLYVK